MSPSKQTQPTNKLKWTIKQEHLRFRYSTKALLKDLVHLRLERLELIGSNRREGWSNECFPKISPGWHKSTKRVFQFMRIFAVSNSEAIHRKWKGCPQSSVPSPQSSVLDHRSSILSLQSSILRLQVFCEKFCRDIHIHQKSEKKCILLAGVPKKFQNSKKYAFAPKNSICGIWGANGVKISTYALWG